MTMHAFLKLPPSLLILLAAQLTAPATAQNDNGLPAAIRKMSLDEGEKFMPEYFAFADPFPLPRSGYLSDRSFFLTPEEEALLALNSSASLAFRPPFPRHRGLQSKNNSEALYRRARDAIARLQGRDFSCPSGTHACTNISETDYCCTDGTTCFVVEDAPNAGNVGCCPDGQTCGGSVADCRDGSTSCPAEEGGGCCIEGFICAQVGCIASTVTAITSTTTSTTMITWPTPTTSVVTVTVIITPTTSPADTTSTHTVTSTASDDSSTSTNTGGGLPPDRPTSSAPTTSTTKSPTTTKSSSTYTPDYCPTGFYACVASAGSGCCRTGRDCSTTSCPPVASTTVVNGNGATVVVPVSDADAVTTTASCANGWFKCGADAGDVPGCCPSGYACGTASCTLSAATATATVQKELPGNVASSSKPGAGVVILGLLISLVGFIW
ncbi:hypothetical protein F5Y18DRAFT_15934 [Xylariaceae sp. FL1019]|nr:hypothetical protein F5Y18DRAFT_15934 [Xylariaceae sp. FL1019]